MLWVLKRTEEQRLKFYILLILLGFSKISFLPFMLFVRCAVEINDSAYEILVLKWLSGVGPVKAQTKASAIVEGLNGLPMKSLISKILAQKSLISKI